MDIYALVAMVTREMDLVVPILMSVQAIITVALIHSAKIHTARLRAYASQDILEMGANVKI